MDFTINFGAINLLVVFAATLASNLLGGIWYSPLVFGKPWAKANNINLGEQGMRNVPATFIASFVLQLIIASLIAALLGPNAGGMEGVQLGFIMAFSFVLTAMGMTNLFECRPIHLIMINSFYHIVSFCLMGFIIGAWG
ncbi:MAG: DUF1761 domain-containing protein [Gammaproteobacteria bacterium]|nr:DUF1761 domain-containing protein [Gammaproteobacteria bacterium]MCP4089813.1 DUF1761 domain-containing protein [Gammaproteobacteria bacterium]MCP4275337.1 DUF1761 domain-containing protein [Gammaproteobacteria bacterium]MCP4831228.1 DUF1761 domain-containing protein [Gammaproteobacteria bacterium]MCP4927639.1 DUF1761 domain-containing protein [Gammaproteobacteria bacterium]